MQATYKVGIEGSNNRIMVIPKITSVTAIFPTGYPRTHEVTTDESKGCNFGIYIEAHVEHVYFNSKKEAEEERNRLIAAINYYWNKGEKE